MFFSRAFYNRGFSNCLSDSSRDLFLHAIESQHGCVLGSDIWKPPVSTTQAQPPGVSCPGLCPDNFLITSRMETPWLLWEAEANVSAQSPSQWKNDSLCSKEPSCVSVGLPLVLSQGTTGKSLALFSLHLPFRFLYTLARFPIHMDNIYTITKYWPPICPYFSCTQCLRMETSWHKGF